jgi:hypothetical protein
MTSREAIFAALFAKATASTGLVTKSRTLKTWADTASAEQPALFQAEGKQAASTHAGLPTKWTFRAELVLYVHASTCNTADVVTTLNNEVDAIVAALDRDPATGTQTLGGLVHDCRISGDIETDEGRLGQQAVAIIPIEIIANV